MRSNFQKNRKYVRSDAESEALLDFYVFYWRLHVSEKVTKAFKGFSPNFFAMYCWQNLYCSLIQHFHQFFQDISQIFTCFSKDFFRIFFLDFPIFLKLSTKKSKQTVQVIYCTISEFLHRFWTFLEIEWWFNSQIVSATLFGNL